MQPYYLLKLGLSKHETLKQKTYEVFLSTI